MTYRYVYGCCSCGERSVHETQLSAWNPACAVSLIVDHVVHRCCDGTLGKLDIVGYVDSEWNLEPLPPGDDVPELPPTDNMGWIRVEDGLPGIDIVVLVVDDHEVVAAVRTGYTFNSGWESSRGGFDLDNVTHWRHLPSLPEGK